MNDDSKLQRLIDTDYKRLSSEPKLTKLRRSTGYWVSRIVVRSVRILFGLTLAAVALWLGSIAAAILDKPLAALTLGNLLQLIVAVLAATAAALSALAAAFGEAATRPNLRAQIDAAVRQRAERESAEAAHIAVQQSRAARWYRHGRLVGLLFDPTLAKRHKWLPWVAVIGAYVVLGLVIALVSRAGS